MGRRFLVMGAMAALAACTVIPKPQGPVAPRPEPTETAPQANVLPTDASRHRVALLVPMTGPNASVGQSIANAAMMALLDTNAQNLRITTYDTAAGAGAAANKAILDGNRLILGPLLAEDVVAGSWPRSPARPGCRSSPFPTISSSVPLPATSSCIGQPARTIHGPHRAAIAKGAAACKRASRCWSSRPAIYGQRAIGRADRSRSSGKRRAPW